MAQMANIYSNEVCDLLLGVNLIFAELGDLVDDANDELLLQSEVL